MWCSFLTLYSGLSDPHFRFLFLNFFWVMNVCVGDAAAVDHVKSWGRPNASLNDDAQRNSKPQAVSPRVARRGLKPAKLEKLTSSYSEPGDGQMDDTSHGNENRKDTLKKLSRITECHQEWPGTKISRNGPCSHVDAAQRENFHLSLKKVHQQNKDRPAHSNQGNFHISLIQVNDYSSDSLESGAAHDDDGSRCRSCSPNMRLSLQPLVVDKIRSSVALDSRYSSQAVRLPSSSNNAIEDVCNDQSKQELSLPPSPGPRRRAPSRATAERLSSEIDPITISKSPGECTPTPVDVAAARADSSPPSPTSPGGASVASASEPDMAEIIRRAIAGRTTDANAGASESAHRAAVKTAPAAICRQAPCEAPADGGGRKNFSTSYRLPTRGPSLSPERRADSDEARRLPEVARPGSPGIRRQSAAQVRRESGSGSESAPSSPQTGPAAAEMRASKLVLAEFVREDAGPAAGGGEPGGEYGQARAGPAGDIGAEQGRPAGAGSEAAALRARMRSMEEKLRAVIEMQNQELALERGEVAGLGGKLSAACRVIEQLKQQAGALGAELGRLRAREAELEGRVTELGAQLEAAQQLHTAAAAVTATASVEEAEDAAEARRKVRLARDQMALLMAKHSKEVAAWSSTCDELRAEAARGRATEEELRASVASWERLEALRVSKTCISRKRVQNLNRVPNKEILLSTRNRITPGIDCVQFICLGATSGAIRSISAPTALVPVRSDTAT